MIVISQWRDAVVFDLESIKATTEDTDVHYVRVNGLLFGRYDTWEDAKEVVSQAIRGWNKGSKSYQLPREDEI